MAPLVIEILINARELQLGRWMDRGWMCFFFFLTNHRCAKCMEYLPTLGQEWLHSWGNVSKYFLHLEQFGNVFTFVFWVFNGFL